MSLSDRRSFVLGLCLLAAGCGYAPAYGPDGSAATMRGRIEVAEPSDAPGFFLVRELEQRLGEVESPQYRLDANIRTATDSVGILPDQTITRYQIRGVVDYKLSDLASGEVVDTGRVSNFTSYSATSTTLATTTAQRDAMQRLMITLADQIVGDLTLGWSDIAP